MPRYLGLREGRNGTMGDTRSVRGSGVRKKREKNFQAKPEWARPLYLA